MKRHLWSVIVSGLGIAGIVGCSHCGHQPLFPNAPWNKNCGCAGGARPGPAPVGLAPGQPLPIAPEGVTSPPPGNTFSPTPGSAFIQPPTGQPSVPAGPGVSVPPAPAPSPPAEIRGYGPISDSTWHAPANGGVRLAIPEMAPSRDANNATKPNVSESKTSEPPQAPAPVDIPQFTQVYERVASGIRPSGYPGLDWLKANNYHAVLYLRRTSDDEASDRREMESRGIKYLSIEVQPQSLRENLDQFNQIVNDTSHHPLFVYSRDSMVTGSLWYLHFRTVNHMLEAEARSKAARVGLQEEQTDANRPLWLAIQKTLEQIR